MREVSPHALPLRGTRPRENRVCGSSPWRLEPLCDSETRYLVLSATVPARRGVLECLFGGFVVFSLFLGTPHPPVRTQPSEIAPLILPLRRSFRPQDGQDGLQDGFQDSQADTKMAQDGPRRLKRPPRRHQDGPRGPQDGPRRPKRAPRGPRGEPEEANNIDFL